MIMSRQKKQLIFLMGPTASGKTSLAIKLRQYLPVEIISVDSALIYRGMNIGTAKPNAIELELAPHRLIDIIDPTESYSVANFYYDAIKAIENIINNDRIPLMIGGTMFYFKILLEGLPSLPPANPTIRACIERDARLIGWRALHQKLKNIDPIAAGKIHYNDLQRLSRALEVFFISGNTITELNNNSSNSLKHKYQIHQFSIAPINRLLLNNRIEQRFKQMLINGFESEVKILFNRGDLCKRMASIRCAGYRQMWSYLSGEISYHEMISSTIYATKQIAKRQMNWLKKWSDFIYWLNSDELTVSLNKILKVIYYM